MPKRSRLQRKCERQMLRAIARHDALNSEPPKFPDSQVYMLAYQRHIDPFWLAAKTIEREASHA